MSPIGLGQWPMMPLVIVLRMAGTIEISGLAQKARNLDRPFAGRICGFMPCHVESPTTLLRTTSLQLIDQNIDYFGANPLGDDWPVSSACQRRACPAPKTKTPPFATGSSLGGASQAARGRTRKIRPGCAPRDRAARAAHSRGPRRSR